MVPNYSADLLDASLSKPVCAAVTNVPHARAVAEDSGLRPFCSCFQFKQCNLHICAIYKRRGATPSPRNTTYRIATDAQ